MHPNVFLPILNPLAPRSLLTAELAPLRSISPNKAPLAACDSTPSVLTQTWKGLVLEHTVPIGTCAVPVPADGVYP